MQPLALIVPHSDAEPRTLTILWIYSSELRWASLVAIPYGFQLLSQRLHRAPNFCLIVSRYPIVSLSCNSESLHLGRGVDPSLSFWWTVDTAGNVVPMLKDANGGTYPIFH